MGARLIQNEVGDPPFFFFTLLTYQPRVVKVSEIRCLKIVAQTSLNLVVIRRKYS